MSAWGSAGHNFKLWSQQMDSAGTEKGNALWKSAWSSNRQEHIADGWMHAIIPQVVQTVVSTATPIGVSILA